ncbi:ribosome recycling factor [Mycoplasma sp. 1331]|uniref:Ribosome-recycling factor n=1 Tax=Mycoplasma tauri TaxID=547987 RepID=A0A953T9P1_9MOLU|nr:ribosome recycling factor [Mycoplasma tauri]MBZ4195464.1 ribosome recycling factor [Mycoplasma tauri]
MDLNLYILKIEDDSEKIINHLNFELSKISTGRANPQLIKGIRVNYYDAPTPLEELASISVPEAQQLLIKPYDISCIRDIIKSITNASLGINPVDEGNQIRIKFPPLTTERRKELVKSLSKHAENAKVGIRNIRQSINKIIKSEDEMSEDEEKRALAEIQKFVDKKISEIDLIISSKEKEIMQI